MSKYQLVTTTAVSSSSVSIVSGLGTGAVVEVQAVAQAIWINVAGGAASVNGANCLYIPADQSVRVDIESGVTAINAIRHSADGHAQVAVVS